MDNINYENNVQVNYLLFLGLITLFGSYKLFKRIFIIIFRQVDLEMTHQFPFDENDFNYAINDKFIENNKCYINNLNENNDDDKESENSCDENEVSSDEEILKESLDINLNSNEKMTNIINELKTVITTEDVREIFVENMSNIDSQAISELINNKIHEKILNYIKTIETKTENIGHDDHVEYERNEDIVSFD